MGYNPNDCVEARWGAPVESEETSTCKAHASQAQRAKMMGVSKLVFMIGCPSSAAVNVKGQTLLNLLANWRDPVDSILERVWQATQWSFFPDAVRR